MADANSACDIRRASWALRRSRAQQDPLFQCDTPKLPRAHPQGAGPSSTVETSWKRRSTSREASRISGLDRPSPAITTTRSAVVKLVPVGVFEMAMVRLDCVDRYPIVLKYVSRRLHLGDGHVQPTRVDCLLAKAAFGDVTGIRFLYVRDEVLGPRWAPRSAADQICPRSRSRARWMVDQWCDPSEDG